MDTYWLTEKENFEMTITAENYANNLMNDVEQHKYEHMYEQTYTGRIQYSGRKSNPNIESDHDSDS